MRAALKAKVYVPDPRAHAVYAELYGLYQQLHDAFGTKAWPGNLRPVMKDLLALRNRARK